MSQNSRTKNRFVFSFLTFLKQPITGFYCFLCFCGWKNESRLIYFTFILLVFVLFVFFQCVSPAQERRGSDTCRSKPSSNSQAGLFALTKKKNSSTVLMSILLWHRQTLPTQPRETARGKRREAHAIGCESDSAKPVDVEKQCCAT